MRGVWRWQRLKWQLRLRKVERALAAFPRSRRRPHSLPFPLIVSLTSYPPRFATLAKTLKSLLDQAVRPDRTILWIAHTQLHQLPDDVRALESAGLEIRGCEDLRSYKKLVPALLAHPDATIVTADDDLYYPPRWLGDLVNGFDMRDPSIVCARPHLATIDVWGNLLPYHEWPMETSAERDTDSRSRLFPTGGAGALYPPGCFPPEVTDTALFNELCPTADDVWFFWLAEMAGTPQRRVGRRSPLITWGDSQEVGLLHDNVVGGMNDRQLAALANRWGPLTRYPNNP